MMWCSHLGFVTNGHSELLERDNTERNHQGQSDRIIYPEADHLGASGTVQRRQRLAGVLNRYVHYPACSGRLWGLSLFAVSSHA